MNSRSCRTGTPTLARLSDPATHRGCSCTCTCLPSPSPISCNMLLSDVAGSSPAHTAALPHPPAPPRLPGLSVDDAGPKDPPHLMLGLCLDQINCQQLSQRSCTGIGKVRADQELQRPPSVVIQSIIFSSVSLHKEVCPCMNCISFPLVSASTVGSAMVLQAVTARETVRLHSLLTAAASRCSHRHRHFCTSCWAGRCLLAIGKPGVSARP